MSASPLAVLAALALPAWADPGHGATSEAEGAPFSFELEASLGAQWVAWVGEEASLTALDPAAAPNVRLAQSAAELHLSGPAGAFGAVRVEEGIFHAGALEAGEAYGGLAAPGDAAGFWIGRSDLAMTRDREMEPEGMALSLRPAISSLHLPLHVAGAGAWGRWKERASLSGGVAYASATADAPVLWLRAALHPLGPLPSRQGEPVEAFRVQLGAGGLSRDSEALGPLQVGAVDLEMRWRGWLLGGGWLYAEDSERAWSWLVEAGGPALVGGDWDLHLHGRYEDVFALLEGEDRRRIGTARLSWRGAERTVQVYTEGRMSREIGAAASPGEDVIVLDDGIERANDSAALGVLFFF